MYKRSLKIFIIIIIFGITQPVFSQTGTYRVFFKDKGPNEFKTGSELYNSTLKLYNERALKRRSKVITPDSIITYDDAPVYKPYIDTCLLLGSELKLKLRWKNYIVVICDSIVADSIGKLYFVSKVQATGNKLTAQNAENATKINTIYVNDENNIQYYENCENYDYGPSFRQAQLMNVPLIHSFGINGKGVLIGFLDTGFRWKSHSSLVNASVKGEYDFVNNDSITGNEDGDSGKQDEHGTAVFSLTGGFSQGNLIGIAPNADFLLSKTENLSGEKHLEEDNFASAIEWMESQGVDITSSSLGYMRFDSTDSNYKYSELDGKTTIVSQAVNNAVKRGVICITAAGNSGPNPGTIVSPGDADSAITVGAVSPDGKTPASFTSRGPRIDGKIKPDISGMGVQVFAANVSEPYSFGFGGGTSFATPLVSGAVGLIMQVFPELKPWEVRSLLLSTSSNKENPDDTLGYGIPNIMNAMLKRGIIISPISTYKLNQYQRIIVYLASSQKLINTELNIKFSGTGQFEKYKLYPTVYQYQYTADIPLSRFNSEIAECYIIAEDLEKTRRYPYYEDEFVTIEPYSRKVQCGVPVSQTEEFAKDKPEAYLYPSIIEDSRNEIELIVPLSGKSNVQIDLYDLLGNRIHSNIFESRESGIASYPVSIQNLSIGSYFLNVIFNGKIESIPFIIIKR